jgi:crotonobetaine/carnitine-CoA ligase
MNGDVAARAPFIVEGSVPPSVPFEDRTMRRMLERQAARFGDKPLISYRGSTRSYAQACEDAARHAARLAAAGVAKGDRVLAMADNRPEMIELFAACGWCGAIFTPINTALRGEQLRHVVSNADPALVVIARQQLPHLARLEAPTPSLRAIWVLDHGADVALRWNGVEAGPVPAVADPAPAPEVRPGDPLTIIYTSGTTGPSKGVLCPQAQYHWWAHFGRHFLGIREDDVLFTVLPMFHMNALSAFMQAVIAGATYTFETRFSASRFWQQLADSGATVTYLLGAMAHILLDRPESEYREHHARIALSPATPAPVVERFAERFGIQLVDGFGSTECNHIMSSNLGSFEPGTMGRPTPEYEVMIADDDDREVPEGVPGELLVRPREPYSMALGYVAMPEATLAAWRNLWFHTGDRALRRADGIFQFVDRKKDAIRRRGENISSHEVEQALATHPDVAAAAVIGVESRIGEEEVMAFVQLWADRRPDPEALIRHLEPRLAYFAIPRYLEFVDALPLTDNGKVRKPELRARGIQASTWDREAAGIVLKR